jgi:exopolysaccharide biosynthesis protein
MVFNINNQAYFFSSTQTFKDVATFEQTYNTKISAAIANKPVLIYNNINIIDSQELDAKQATVKSYRGALGLKNNKVYLVVVTNATVIDLAGIMESLSMEQAMNLDGGGSSALYYQGVYKVGPGRNLPNALIFKIKN